MADPLRRRGDPSGAGPAAAGRPRATLSRRRLLAGGGVASAGLLAGAAAGVSVSRAEAGGATAGARSVPFDGAHQAGITTAAPDRMLFATFDVTAGTAADLRRLLEDWTHAARRMVAGRPVDRLGPWAAGSAPDTDAAPPVDTGEAGGLGPASLTLTVGFGPSLFDGRSGLARLRPAALAEVPPMPGDALDPARSGGDLAVQACADDPQVAFHAVHALVRLGLGTVTLRALQSGFSRASAMAGDRRIARNLLGFLDGIGNPSTDDARAMDAVVWVGPETDQRWMEGGTYLVARRVRIDLEAWDRTALGLQEQAVGRHKGTGAPLGATTVDAPLDLARLPADSHVRLAAPSLNGGVRLLRRGYSYTDGVDPRTGELDAGLFFVCFQRDPRRQFVPIQRRLSASDALYRYLVHTSSAVFACPPGTAAGGAWGDGLLAGV